MVFVCHLIKYFSDYPVIRPLLGQTTSEDHGQGLKKPNKQKTNFRAPVWMFESILSDFFLQAGLLMRTLRTGPIDHTVSPILDTPYVVSGQPPCLCRFPLVSSMNRCISPASSSSVMSSLRKRCCRAGLHWLRVRLLTKLETFTTRPKNTHTVDVRKISEGGCALSTVGRQKTGSRNASLPPALMIGRKWVNMSLVAKKFVLSVTSAWIARGVLSATGRGGGR